MKVSLNSFPLSVFRRKMMIGQQITQCLFTWPWLYFFHFHYYWGLSSRFFYEFPEIFLTLLLIDFPRFSSDEKKILFLHQIIKIPIQRKFSHKPFAFKSRLSFHKTINIFVCWWVKSPEVQRNCSHFREFLKNGPRLKLFYPLQLFFLPSFSLHEKNFVDGSFKPTIFTDFQRTSFTLFFAKYCSSFSYRKTVNFFDFYD